MERALAVCEPLVQHEVCRLRCAVPEDIEDLEQEGRLAVLEALPKYRGNGRAGGLRWFMLLPVRGRLEMCFYRDRMVGEEATA